MPWISSCADGLFIVLILILLQRILNLLFLLDRRHLNHSLGLSVMPLKIFLFRKRMNDMNEIRFRLNAPLFDHPFIEELVQVHNSCH